MCWQFVWKTHEIQWKFHRHHKILGYTENLSSADHGISGDPYVGSPPWSCGKDQSLPLGSCRCSLDERGTVGEIPKHKNCKQINTICSKKCNSWFWSIIMILLILLEPFAYFFSRHQSQVPSAPYRHTWSGHAGWDSVGNLNIIKKRKHFWRVGALSASLNTICSFTPKTRSKVTALLPLRHFADFGGMIPCNGGIKTHQWYVLL